MREARMTLLPPLPVDAMLPGLIESLEKHAAAVLTAEPGAGKTTRVPPALADAACCRGGQVWVLEPRRVAAMMAATRVAEEKGEQVGGTVGYHFRFERAESADTRVLFLTEGMFLRRLQGNPNLDGVAAVVLDEFHERSLDADLALAMLSRLRAHGREDLKLLVMSATLDSEAVSAFLDKAPVIHCPGRLFPVTLKYLETDRSDAAETLERKVLRAVRDLRTEGDLLVFLPGAAEIRRAQARLQGDPSLDACLILPFHGSLSASEQRQVLAPASRRKIILATAIAETSLTVPGVRAVIDSGLSRRDAFNPWSGLSSLVTVLSSQASMIQRTGRAGREAPGTCVRLCSAAEFAGRASYEPSEILRADLSSAMLQSLSAGFEDLEGLDWLEAPPPAHLEAAKRLLSDLGAMDAGILTAKGKSMARAPLHPRLASAALESAASTPEEMDELCRCLCMLSEEKARDLDFWTALKRYVPMGSASRLMKQLGDWLESAPGRSERGPGPSWRERLAKALLNAFPDQVAYARKPSDKRGECRFTLAGGGDVMARDEAAHFQPGYYLLLEILEQKHLGGSGNMPRVLSLIPLEEAWLLDCPARLREEKEIRWDADTKRVLSRSRLLFGILLLSEGPLHDPQSKAKAEEMLRTQAHQAGLAAFCPEGQPARYLARREFALKAHPQGAPDLPDEAALWALLDSRLEGMDSFGALRGADILKQALDKVGHAGRTFLDSYAPKSLRLASGRELGISYEPGKSPSVSSRLQDFFGMRDTPRIGSQVLSLNLLAPNQRPVQITSDLAGFWEREYPRLRKELGRKYPRHAWPENPV